MGYTTDFWGDLKLSKNLTDEQFTYINLFSSTRRIKRDPNKLMEIYKGKHGIPTPESNTPEGIYGVDGGYYVKDEFTGIVNYNEPPSDQPGLWCQWVVINRDTDTILEWDGLEKFYHYTEWLKYLIKHFFSKWGVYLNGEIEWQGEDSSDFGKIVVENNVVTEKVGRKVYD